MPQAELQTDKIELSRRGRAAGRPGIDGDSGHGAGSQLRRHHPPDGRVLSRPTPCCSALPTRAASGSSPTGASRCASCRASGSRLRDGAGGGWAGGGAGRFQASRFCRGPVDDSAPRGDVVRQRADPLVRRQDPGCADDFWMPAATRHGSGGAAHAGEPGRHCGQPAGTAQDAQDVPQHIACGNRATREIQWPGSGRASRICGRRWTSGSLCCTTSRRSSLRRAGSWGWRR